MYIQKIEKDKRAFLDLLLLADEQEDMIERYLDQGDMFALYDGALSTICVVTCDEETCEIKNIATVPERQGHGYGRQMIQYVEAYYAKDYDYLLVGTGDSPLTLPFYEHCGFKYAFRIKNFFTDNYDHPIFEAGQQLRDMVYFRKPLK